MKMKNFLAILVAANGEVDFDRYRRRSVVSVIFYSVFNSLGNNKLRLGQSDGTGNSLAGMRKR